MTPGERFRAILLSQADTATKAVLMAVADAMHEDRLTSWLSVETIADRASLCERQARSVIAQAEQLGVLHRWKGEHAQRDCEIRWEVLAALRAAPSKRGGRRKVANIATEHAAIAPSLGGTDEPAQSTKTMQPLPPAGGGKHCQENMQCLHGNHAMFAAESSNHCPLSGSEADHEADLEAVPTPAGPAAEPAPRQVELLRLGWGPPAEVAAHARPGAAGTVAPPPAATPPPDPTKAKRPPNGHGKRGSAALSAEEAEAKRLHEVFLVRVSDQFGEAFIEVFGEKYPWIFVGPNNDRARRAIWVEAARIRQADPEPGLLKLRQAALAYCRAVKAQTAWPKDEAANTTRFTEKIATWLQSSRSLQAAPPARPLTMQERAAQRRDRPVVVDTTPLRLDGP